MFKQIYSTTNPLLGKAQQYRILIDNQDVTKWVTGDVSLSEEKGLLPELTFTLTDGDKWLKKLVYGSNHSIVFSGGSLNPANGFKDKFIGTLFRSVGSFGKDGVKVSITAFGKSWKGGTNPKSFIYPSPNCERKWARSSSLTLTTIVTNLAEEIGLKVGHINVKPLKRNFSYENPLRQNNQTDWSFLLYIAQRMEAIVWEENEKIYFEPVGSMKKVSKADSRISFVYQDPKNPIILSHNQVLVSEISVQEDSEAQLTFSRPRNKETGDEVALDWQLNSAKVAKEAETNPDKLWQVLGRVWSDTITDAELNEYFIPVESKKAFKDDPFIEGDNSPFLGKTLNFTIPGNSQVLAYQYYPIYNISRFSSKDDSGWWFLQKLVHSWGSSGFTTRLDFIR